MPEPADADESTDRCGGDTERFEHNLFGHIDDHPHAEIDLHFGEWHEAAQEALGYKLGPPIAWEYDDGTLYLWGEKLDEDMLIRIADACHEVERDHADMGIYDAAETAERAASKISRGEVVRQNADTDRIEASGE